MPKKTVQPPTAGTINQTVAPVKVETLAKRALTTAAPLGNGVSVTLAKTVAMKATARIPGEVAGPAVAVSVEFTNTGTKPVSLQNVVVNALTANKVPGNLMSTPPAAPLHGELAPGKSAIGVYVLTLPLSHRNPITVTVNYTPKAPTAVFVGNVK